jgi:hypothetical protein
MLQFGRMLLGYCAASLGASSTALLILYAKAALTTSSAGGPQTSFDMMVKLVVIGSTFVAFHAFIPAVVVIALGAIPALKRWYFYCVGGGLTGLIVYLWRVGQPLTGRYQSMLDDPRSLMVASGCVAGLIYWAVAVRRTRNSEG